MNERWPFSCLSHFFIQALCEERVFAVGETIVASSFFTLANANILSVRLVWKSFFPSSSAFTSQTLLKD